MKLRKLASVVALSAAMIVGGASAAAADHAAGTYFDQGFVLGTTIGTTWSHTHGVVLHHGGTTDGLGRHHLAHIDIPHTAFRGLTLNGDWVSDDNYEITEGSTNIHLNSDYVRSLPEGTHQFAAHFDYNGHTVVTLPMTISRVGGETVAEVRPQHPATGPAAMLYGVGGLLLAGGGVSVVAASKRRKAESV